MNQLKVAGQAQETEYHVSALSDMESNMRLFASNLGKNLKSRSRLNFQKVTEFSEFREGFPVEYYRSLELRVIFSLLWSRKNNDEPGKS